MLQHIEFEVYVNKHHIWLLGKKRNRCKTKCDYHTVTKLYIVYYQMLRNFFQKCKCYKVQLYNILSKHIIYIYIYIYIYLKFEIIQYITIRQASENLEFL